MSEMYRYLINAIIATIIMLGGLITMKYYNQPPTLVKIDLVAITTHYTQMMLTNTLNANNIDASKQVSDVIKTNLEPIISDYAQKHNAIIVQSQALVDGRVTDITDIIIVELDKKIKK